MKALGFHSMDGMRPAKQQAEHDGGLLWKNENPTFQGCMVRRQLLSLKKNIN